MTTTSTDYRELTQAVSKQLATLRTDIPDVMKGFGDCHGQQRVMGRLTKKPRN